MFESINFRRNNWKITMLGKSEYLFVVPWHGRSCQEMCGTILWVGEQDDTKTQHGINSMLWRPSFQRRRIEIRGRIVKSMLSNCSEMLVLDTYWKAWYSMVSEQICTIDYKMDRSLWQNDYLVWFPTFIIHVITNNIVMWETRHSIADWDCFKTPILHEILMTQNLLQVEHYAFSEAIRLSPLVGCARNKLQFHTVQQNPKSSLWTLDWDWTGFPRLIYGIWSSQFFTETRIRMIKYGETRRKPPTRKKNHGNNDNLDTVDFISSNVNSSWKEALLYIFEDNEAVIKMIIKGRSPTMRHVSRTRRVALDWLFDRINQDSKIKYIDTKNQIAYILTKGNSTRDVWNHLLCLFNISHFSSAECSEVMSKRTQEDASEERVTAKSKPMMNLVSRYRERDPNVLASIASESPGQTKSESQNLLLSSLNVQQTSTGRPVLGASSSNYLEWNINDKILLNVEHKYGETRIWQVCHRWWYGLWHRRRIEPLSGITIILEQGEWSFAKDVGPFSRRFNERHW